MRWWGRNRELRPPKRQDPKACRIGEEAKFGRNGAISCGTKACRKIAFARPAAMGRFGRAALKPIYELISEGGGDLPQMVGRFFPSSSSAFDSGIRTGKPSQPGQHVA